MLSAREIEDWVRRIVLHIQPEKILLFGSYARGTPTSRSDLDFLVIKETDMPFARRADDLKPMLSRALVAVDVHVYTPEEVAEYGKDQYSFLGTVLQSGRTVYEK